MTSLANNPSRRTKPTGDRSNSARYTVTAGQQRSSTASASGAA